MPSLETLLLEGGVCVRWSAHIIIVQQDQVVLLAGRRQFPFFLASPSSPSPVFLRLNSPMSGRKQGGFLALISSALLVSARQIHFSKHQVWSAPSGWTRSHIRARLLSSCIIQKREIRFQKLLPVILQTSFDLRTRSMRSFVPTGLLHRSHLSIDPNIMCRYYTHRWLSCPLPRYGSGHVLLPRNVHRPPLQR